MLFQINVPDQSDDEDVQIEAPTKVVAEVIGFYHNEEGSPCWSLNSKGLHFTTSSDDFAYIKLTQKTGGFMLNVGHKEKDDIFDITLHVTSVQEVHSFPPLTTK